MEYDNYIQSLIDLLYPIDWSDPQKFQDAGKLLRETGESTFSVLMNIVNASEKEERLKAIAGLGFLNDARALSILVELLHSKDEDIRNQADWSLGNINSDRHIDILLHALNDESAFVRGSIVRTLARTTDNKAINALIKQLADPDADVRETVAFILETVGHIDNIEPLLKALNNDPNDRVRRRVALTLGRLQDERAIQPLTQALSDDKIYSSVATSLGKFGKKSVEPLIRALNNENPDVRVAVVKTLGIIRDKRAVEPLIELLEDSNKQVVERVAISLGMIGDKRATEPLIEVFNTDNDIMLDKGKILEGIGYLKDVHGLDTLMSAIDDDELYADAAIALGWLGNTDERVITALINATSLDEFEVTEAANKIIMKAGDKATKPLSHALSHKNDLVRTFAATKLSEVGTSEEISPLIYVLLNDPYDMARLMAADALGKIGDESCIASLKVALEDRDQRIVERVKQALQKLQNDSEIEH